MDNSLNKPLKYTQIAHPARDIIGYIDKRRKGNIKSLKTRWKKFNDQCMGGIEPNSIYTIAGISGSGKSAFANSLESDLFDMNPDIDFVVLSFNFEMLASRQVGRKLSYKMKKTTQELYSGLSNHKLSDYDYSQAIQEAKKLKDLPIYYCDHPGTVQQIKNTIVDFSNSVAKDKWLVVLLDHTLLTRGKSGEKEREILAELQYMFMDMKKYNKNSIIQLSQMNREIEASERINNNFMHFPIRRDIFGGEQNFLTFLS